ncbi:MAG: hypothetical protein IH845_01530 [Nanoarchaeota archaeon]|nr:hypothetical protein [Nanoarchaeota archaeon]
MKVENIFYTIGVLFIISSVVYFTNEFIADLSDPVKLTLLIVAIIASAIIAELFRKVNK